MLNSRSVKTRFAVSFASNGLRAVLSFGTGLILARALTPSGYGDLSFLLGSFVALRSLLDLGTSNAFYTFISQERRPAAYYSYYFLWLCAQFALTAAVILALLPADLVDRVWLGHSRHAVLLAFAASFLQQQVWQTVNQAAEAARDTVKVQALNLALALFYLAGAAALAQAGLISVNAVLLLILAQYAVFTAAAAVLLRRPATQENQPAVSFRQMLAQYGTYCSPLILLSVMGFAHDFADKWLLQFFGGAGQQGFYQAAFQFSTISILATSSMLNILWKEVSEAERAGDKARIERLFRKVSRGLYMTGAVISGFLIPWSRELLELFLGEAYAPAAPAFAVMLLFPLHQSLGQVAGTLMLAGARTRQYMWVSAFFMLVSLPVSYLLQAPASGALPGLGLGAAGMAVKMVGLNIISVNVMFWVISRSHGWRCGWAYQAVGAGALIAAGYLAKLAVSAFGAAGTSPAALILPVVSAGMIYLAAAYLVLRSMPWLAGMDRSEFDGYMGRLQGLFAAGGGKGKA